jgi:hypothetical protein
MDGDRRKIIKEPDGKVDNIVAAGYFNSNVLDLQVFSYADVDEATNKFALEIKLGEGGYGPIYKVNFFNL